MRGGMVRTIAAAATTIATTVMAIATAGQWFLSVSLRAMAASFDFVVHADNFADRSPNQRDYFLLDIIVLTVCITVFLGSFLHSAMTASAFF
jgi:hypothetical protein